MTNSNINTLSNSDDIAIGFALENAPVRGQIVRLGPATADEILSRQNQHPIVSKLLGELLCVSVLAGASIKMDGKLIIEVKSEYNRFDTPIDFIVAEYTNTGTIRGMAKVNHNVFDKFIIDNPNPNLKELFGDGVMMNTLDLFNTTERYQGQVAIDDCKTISELATNYFEYSEQLSSKIMLCTDYVDNGTSHKEWRSYGIMIQKIAPDDARGDTQDIWAEACMKLATLKPSELLDSTFSQAEILYNLYHENNVMAFTPKLLLAKCNCSRNRLINIMRQYANDDLEEMLEEDGKIHIICEFCNTNYKIDPVEIKSK